MRLQSFLTTITPFSKIIALSLFVTLPIIAFYFGYKYHQLTLEPKIEYITKEKIVYQQQEDNERKMVKRCGEYPELPQMYERKWGAKVSGNISWSPDCKNLAWSNNQIIFCENGPGDLDNCSQIPSIQTNGLYIYNTCSKKTEKALSSILQDDDPTFIKWIDSTTLLYSDRMGRYQKEYKIKPQL